ncbi:hypothetical protein GCM10023169_28310 [Georgenia halophila]|uniref:Gas vesicle protein n=1 Tax=Georgenia halophila TaxID=620889 RepID=A0ABP8LFB6_9MICO
MSETVTAAPAVSRTGPRPSALEPTRDPGATLPDLLEVLLNKGVYLDLDLIITVADIPLIGVNLKATIAGIETMLEHGMMRSWDEQTREWVRRSLSRQVPLASDEEVVARMAGGYRQEEPYRTWRPGTVYLTSHRLMAWRADPRELLWQVRLNEITGVDLHTERSIGGEERTRLAVTTSSETALLSAAAPQRLHDLLQEQGIGGSVHQAEREADRVLEDRVWYLEELSGGAVWRGGTGMLDRSDGLTWKGALDRRAAVRIRPEELVSIDIEHGRSPAGTHVIVVAGPTKVRIATTDTARWVRELRDLPGAHRLPEGGGT